MTDDGSVQSPVPEPVLISVGTTLLPPERSLAVTLAWIVSISAHVALIVLLGIINLPGWMKGSPVATIIVESGQNVEQSVNLEEIRVVPSHTTPEIGPKPIAVVPPAPFRPIEDAKPMPSELELTSPRASDKPLFTKDLMQQLPSSSPKVAGEGEQLRDATSVEGAVDGLAADIQTQLIEGDLLTVWLIDASVSLVDDRMRIARRLDSVFSRIEAVQSDQPHRLYKAAASFGDNFRVLVPSTMDHQRILNALRTMPTDRSGKENVMAAVRAAAGRFRPEWKGSMMFIVWTDESGDDLNRLEETIDYCQTEGIQVSVVGPTSLLGREIATHRYLDQLNGRTYHLAVRRGPDAALNQRLRLPYWYRAKLPSWHNGQEASGANLPNWYGGPQLEGLSSGTGTYGLTRLAGETGGSFTLLDRQSQRGPFSPQQMKQYLPDLRTQSEVKQEIDNHPLRRAISAAVDITYQQEIDLPTTIFFDKNQPFAVAPIAKVYHTPTEFRRRFAQELDHQEKLCRAASMQIDRALLHLQFSPEQGYHGETSPRWQAWYDLTHGRLLAASVRYREYLRLCRDLKRRDALERDTNHVIFVPAARLRGGGMIGPTADLATQLLRRCVENHSETPWAYLAQRELDHPWGITYRQEILTGPTDSGRPASTTVPSADLPAL